MTRKIGTQLLLSAHMKMRLDALALVRDESNAEIGREVFEIAMPQIEEEHAKVLKDLYAAFQRAGVTRARGLDLMRTHRINVEEFILLDDGEAQRFLLTGIKPAETVELPAEDVPA